MTRDDEILQLLYEIKDAQNNHHTEWQEVVRRSEEQQQRAVREVAKSKRSMWVHIGVLILVLVGIIYLPIVIHSPYVPHSVPELAQYDSPISTPIFDGTYTLDSQKSFPDLHARLADASLNKRQEAQQFLSMTELQFVNFRINHGVITSGKTLVQEFRLVNGVTVDGLLQGRAVWHEDVNDFGDCFAVNVRLELQGDTLEFSYYYDGEEAGSPIVLKKEKH